MKLKKNNAVATTNSDTQEIRKIAGQNSQGNIITVGTEIQAADYRTILLHAEKFHNGQKDFADVLKRDLRDLLGVDNSEELINILNQADSQNFLDRTRLFLSQYSFVIVEEDGTRYQLNGTDLDIVPNIKTPAAMHDHNSAQILQNLPQELLTQPRFFALVGNKKEDLPKDWSNPDKQKFFCDIPQDKLSGFDTCGHGRAADYLFLDFDHVLDDNGIFVNPDAEKWFNYLATIETYCERSISGHGLHFLLKPTPNKFPMFSAGKRGTLYFGDNAKLEIFYASKARYCFFTGDAFQCEPNAEIASGEVADEVFQHLIDEIKKNLPPEPVKKTKTTAQILSDSPDYDAFRAGIMLNCIVPADLPDTDWLAVQSAAKNIGIPYPVVDAWNQQDQNRYNEKQNQMRWNSLDEPSFDISTLHGIAKRFGYQENDAQREWYQLHPEDAKKIQARADSQTPEIESDDEIFNELLNDFSEIDPNILPKLKDAKIFIADLTKQNFKPEYAFDAAIWSKVALLQFYMPSISQKFFDVMKDARRLAKVILKKISHETDVLIKSGEYIPDIDTTAITRLSELAPSKIENEIKSLVVNIKRKYDDFLVKRQIEKNKAARQATIDALAQKSWTQDIISDCPLNLFLPETIFFTRKTIGTQTISENGTAQTRTAAKTPLIVTRILRESNTHTTQYEIQIKARHIWRKIIVDGDELADTRKILRLARDGGAIIKDPRALANFFAELISANEDRLNETKTYDQPGWHGDHFIYPKPDSTDDYICRRAGFNYEQEFATQGNALIWKATFLDACQKGGANARIAFGNVLAAPLVRPLNVANIQCQLDGTSGGGKTALLKFAASTFGNPRKLIRTFGATLKNRQAVAAAYNDLPTFLDELGTLQGGKKGADTLPQMVYEFEQGKMNQAQKRNGDARETFEFYGSRTMTGEFSILKNHDPRGTHKRVIRLKCGEKLFDDEFATKLHITAENHFGHFGRQWTKYVESHLEAIRESYLGFTEYIYREKKVNIEPTQLKAITVDAVAYQHFKIAIGEQETFDFVAAAKDIKAIISTLPTPDELDDSTRAIKDLQSYIAGHDKYFYRDIKNECTGGVISVNPQPFESYGKKFDNGEVAFFPHVLKNILEKELDYQSADALIAEFARKGLLRCGKGKGNGYRISTRINGTPTPTYRFYANAFSNNTDNETAGAENQELKRNYFM